MGNAARLGFIHGPSKVALTYVGDLMGHDRNKFCLSLGIKE